MAEGRVCTGFSKPYVALYSESGGTITYSSGQLLARGVEVSLEPEVGSDNKFYADNIEAEVDAGVFTGGTCTLTVDGLFVATKKLIYGLPTAGTDGFTDYGDDMSIPYVGIGFVARYQSEGSVTYTPYILTKARFQMASLSAVTQGESIEWQTQELVADLMRDDSSDHVWLKEGGAETSEATAEGKIKTFFSIT